MPELSFPGDSTRPCDVEGFVHHSVLERGFQKIGAEVSQEFLFPVDQAPKQVKLEKLIWLAPHYYSARIWENEVPESESWDLLGAVGEGGLAEYKVRHGNIIGWVESYAIKEPRSFDVEPYLYALRKQHEQAEETVRSKYPDLLFHYVGPSLPNSAGGIDVQAIFEVRNNKTVKYVTLELTPFNAVGDRVRDTSPRDPVGRLKYTGPLKKADGLETASWEAVWYNPTITCARVDQIRVEYTDGSNYTYIRELPAILHPEFRNRCVP